MQQRQQMFLADKLTATIKIQPGIATLRNTLLKHGGKEIVVSPDRPDPDLPALLDHGYLMTSSVVCKSKDMEDNRCHQNIGRLWVARSWSSDAEENKSDPLIGIATGYCLNGELWGQHSWGVRKSLKLVESLGKRDLYFGILLQGIEADVFAFKVLGGDEYYWPLFNPQFLERVYTERKHSDESSLNPLRSIDPGSGRTGYDRVSQ
jgi:hypothetical protein